jgi:hypothetical protein
VVLSACEDLLVCGSQLAGTQAGEASSYLVGRKARWARVAVGHPQRAIASLFGISSVVLGPLGV